MGVGIIVCLSVLFDLLADQIYGHTNNPGVVGWCKGAG